MSFTLTGDDIEVSQVVDVMSFSYIFASRQARYELLIDVNCVDGILLMTLSFGTELGESISKSGGFQLSQPPELHYLLIFI